MQATILSNADTSYLDQLLLDGDFLKLLPASEYHEINPEHLQLWAVKHARYGFPTQELIDWLREMIGNQFAIEVAAGQGDLGRHLGIIQTDSYMQQRSEVRAYYALLGQPIVNPPESVLQYEANVAVKGLKPDVVIASWLTQLLTAEESTPEAQGSLYGADEGEIIKNCKLYIHIGNDNAHGQKKVLGLPHRKYYFPWLVSRSADPNRNVIYVWEGHLGNN